jgi:hypothetical protein
MANATKGPVEIRGNLQSAYDDVFTPAVMRALDALAPFDDDCKWSWRRASNAGPHARATGRACRSSSRIS